MNRRLSALFEIFTNSHNYKKMYSIHKYEFLPTPLPFAYRCTCPTVVKSFAKRKDE